MEAGDVVYDSSGLGFAFVDLNHNTNYNTGVDIIVDIVQGSGQYSPGTDEFYYPTDIQGNRWVRNDYSILHNPKINMGALSAWIKPGTIIVLR